MTFHRHINTTCFVSCSYIVCEISCYFNAIFYKFLGLCLILKHSEKTCNISKLKFWVTMYVLIKFALQHVSCETAPRILIRDRKKDEKGIQKIKI